MENNELLKVGQVFKLEPHMAVYAQVEERFVYKNSDSTALTSHKVTIGEVGFDNKGDSYDTKKLAGTCVVTAQTKDGGSSDGLFPDGHHVFAQKLAKDGSYSSKGAKVDFYQTGFFSAMIRPQEITLVEDMVFEQVLVPKKPKMK